MGLLSFVGFLFLGFLFTEIFGYFLHVLLHSEKVPYLSRSHMIHHLKIYGPQKGLRASGPYLGSANDRFSIAGFGMEWMAPILGVTAILFTVFWLLGVPVWGQLVFSASASFWGYIMFGYMHDAMHVEGFWMERNRVLRPWFLRIRKLHDIHHLEFSNDGRMLKNYGICFFFVDRLMGSLSVRHHPFNRKGFAQAQKLYSFIH